MHQRDSHKPLPPPPGQPDDAPAQFERNRKGAYTSIIAPRELPSDNIQPAPRAPAPAAPEKPKLTPFQRRRRIRRAFECAAGVCVLLAIAFLLLPKEVANRDDTPQSVFTPAVVPTPEPETPAEPPRPVAKTADQWVSAAVITGVRPERIIINGRVFKLNAPMPPFDLRWTGRTAEGDLTFQGPDGTEYHRTHAK